MDDVEALPRGLDRALAGQAPPRPELRIVGSTALFAQTTWRRGTKDCDDRHDIEAMVARGVVGHGQLVERFREAITQHGQQGMGHKVPRAIDNLHRVERDIFLVDESNIDLPDGLD